jgi:YHS domain-containing protein
MRTILRSMFLASSLALVACGGSSAQSTEPQHGEHAEAATPPSGTVVPPGDAHVGDTSTCPVSGERFVITDQSPHTDYEGKTYYFCCPGCIERFSASPAQYAHPSAGGEAQPG